MTDRDARRRIVWASVVLVSALTFAASYLVVADVDRPRYKTSVLVLAPVASGQVLPALQRVASVQPPVRGLVPAAAPQRRVITIRRTRAS